MNSPRGSKTILKKQTKNARKSYRKEAMSIEPGRLARRRKREYPFGEPNDQR